jgi:hypothetical protein
MFNRLGHLKTSENVGTLWSFSANFGIHYFLVVKNNATTNLIIAKAATLSFYANMD